MDDKLLIKKIQALYHDPAEKAIILGKIGHESRAKATIGDLIDETKIPEEVKTADHIASAADRVNIRDAGFVADFCKNPIIKHPLSAKEFNLKSLAQIEIEKITFAVDKAIGEIAEDCKGDKEKIYLSLWRCLLDRLIYAGEDGARLGQLWELLPADTRIPDHSIWEHKRITSAIAGSLPKPAFLLFAIGPVQDFIATARKTQDLWAGSYLLSYLSWSAMKVVAEECGPDSLIFPDLCGQPFADKWLITDKRLKVDEPNRDKLSSPTLPNRFLAIVPAASVKDIAERAKNQVQKTFQSVCQSVKEKMAEKCGIQPSTEWENIWSRQTADFIETYWAATAFDDVKDLAGFISEYKLLMGINDNDKWPFDDLLKVYEKGFAPNIGTVYQQIYRLTEKTLGSRKAVRDFSQQAEPNHKCTLCGVREPVHPGTYNNQSCSDTSGALKKWWQEVVLPAFPQIRKSARLCGVCVTKRLSSRHYFKDGLKFDINDNFPSVSMIATASFKLRVIENMNNNNLAVKAGCFVDAIAALAEDRWSGIPVPMVIRACRDEISKKFAKLEGDWLYKETLEDKKTLWEENKSRMSEEVFEGIFSEAKKKREELFDAIKETDKTLPKEKQMGKPSTYYAVLLMDGDNMGKWLSGELAPSIKEVMHPTAVNSLDGAWNNLLKQKRPLNPSLHLALSKALRDFSLHVAREIVEKDHLGKLVYAGGDDVLAFVNLKDLPEVMRKLRAYFSGSLLINEEISRVDIDFKEGSGFIPIDDKGSPLNVGNNKKKIEGFRLSMGTNATASMGVVIAHHNSNLAQVLDEVRDCEKKAKNLKDKNAFCIALAKRAGGTEHIPAHWYYKDISHFEPIPLLRQWADAFYNDWMSPKIVYTFRTETIGLEGLPAPAIRLELLRIANRQRDKKTKDFDKDDMVRLVDGLMNLHAGGLSLDDLSKFLSLAAFLGREGNR